MVVNSLFYTHTHTHTHTHTYTVNPRWLSSKVSTCQCRRYRCVGLIPGLVSSPGGANGNSFQYSCLEIPMDRGAWRVAVRGVTESWTWLSDQTQTHIHTLWGISEGMQEHLTHFISVFYMVIRGLAISRILNYHHKPLNTSLHILPCLL